MIAVAVVAVTCGVVFFLYKFFGKVRTLLRQMHDYTNGTLLITFMFFDFTEREKESVV